MKFSRLTLVGLIALICNCYSSTVSSVIKSFKWSSMPEDSNVLLLNFKDINELRYEIKTFAAKVAVAVSDPEGDKPIEHVRTKRSGPLTLVLFDLTDSANMSLIVKALERLSRFPSLNVLMFVLPPETNMIELGRSLRKSLDGRTNLTVNSMDLYFLVLNDTHMHDHAQGELSTAVDATVLGLYEFYGIKYELFLQELPLERRVNYHMFLQKVVRRRNFHGVQIVAVAQEGEAVEREVAFTKGSNFRSARFESGSAVDIYRILRDELNFTEKAMIGSYIGVVDDKVSGLSYDLLANGTADVSISQVTALPLRAKVFRYLQPTQYDGGVMAIFIQPSSTSMRNIFLAPFTGDVWIALIVVVGAIIALMMIFSSVKNQYPDGKIYQDNPDLAYISDAYVWAIGAMCQKGWRRQPCSLSMRIVFFLGSFIGLIIYVSYSAVIVSVLSVEQVPVSTLEDLVRFKYRFYAHEYSSTMQDYLKQVIGTYGLSQEVLKVSTADEVNILFSSQSALISFGDIFYAAARSMNLTDRTMCRSISNVLANHNPTKSAMFVIKGSPLREYFDHKIIRMKERGFNQRIMNEYKFNTRPMCLQAVSEAHRLDLNDVYVAFVIICIGGLFSLTVLTVERIQFAKTRYRLNHRIINPMTSAEMSLSSTMLA